MRVGLDIALARHQLDLHTCLLACNIFLPLNWQNRVTAGAGICINKKTAGIVEAEG